MVILPKYRANRSARIAQRKALEAAGAPTRLKKVGYSLLSTAMAATLTPGPLEYIPGTATIRPPAAVAHGWDPYGEQVMHDVLKAPNSTVTAREEVNWGNPEAPKLTAIGNEQIFEQDAQLIAQAKHEVILSTYVWDNVDNTRALLNGLSELQVNRMRDAQPGDPPVQVYLLVDDYSKMLQQLQSLVTTGLFTSSYGSWAQIARNGVQGLGLDPKLVNVHVVDFTHTGLGANHAKYTIVDRNLVQVTGANPQFNADAPQYDLGYTVRGAIAHAFWSDAASTLYQADPRYQLQEEPWQLDTDRSPQLPMMFVSRTANRGLIPDKNNPQTVAMCSLFEHATEPVYMMTPNLNDDHVLASIRTALEHGRPVNLLLSHDFNEDKERAFGQGGANDDVVKKLRLWAAENGVSDLLDMRWYSQDGLTASEPYYNSHAKFLASGPLVLEGSGNGDTESNGYTHEVNILTDDRDYAQQSVTTLFMPKWENAVSAG